MIPPLSFRKNSYQTDSINLLAPLSRTPLVHETSVVLRPPMLRYGGTTQNHRAHRVNSFGLGEQEHRLDLYSQGLSSSTNFNERHLTSRCPNASATHSVRSMGETYPRRHSPSQRERHALDVYGNSSLPMMDRFSYQPTRSDDLRNREVYGDELRHQIQDNQRRRQLRDEQNRLDELRYEQLVLRMQELETRKCGQEEHQSRRHSEDLLRRKQELQSRLGYRRHMDSESSVTSCLRTTDVASKPSSSHYSPPVSRRNPQQYSFNVPSTTVFSEPASRYNTSRYATDSQSRRDNLKRMDSLNSYDRPSSRRSTFNRFDSLSRIDSLTGRFDSIGLRDDPLGLSEGQRRHSATHQDLSALRRSPRLQRRSSSGRFEDPLPAPVLKAHSPVARELKNAVPFNSSSRFSETTIRRLEDRWMGSKSMFANLDSFRR